MDVSSHHFERYMSSCLTCCVTHMRASDPQVIGFYFYNLVVNDGSACFMQATIVETVLA